MESQVVFCEGEFLPEHTWVRRWIQGGDCSKLWPYGPKGKALFFHLTLY